MKKIIAFLILGIIAAESANLQVNAIEIRDGYYGYAEDIYQRNNYIIVMKDKKTEVTSEMLGIAKNIKISKVIYDEKNSYNMYDEYCQADFSDNIYDAYKITDDETDTYYINSTDNNLSGDCYESLLKNDNIKEVKKEYFVIRNGIFLGDNNNLIHFEDVAGHCLYYNESEIVKNDANDDGKIDSYDALKVLQAVVGTNILTIKEKINLNMQGCWRLGEHEDYSRTGDYMNSEQLTSEKALEILQQIVNK